jgi:hypothetical protein
MMEIFFWLVVWFALGMFIILMPIIYDFFHGKNFVVDSLYVMFLGGIFGPLTIIFVISILFTDINPYHVLIKAKGTNK